MTVALGWPDAMPHNVHAIVTQLRLYRDVPVLEYVPMTNARFASWRSTVGCAANQPIGNELHA